MAYYSLLRQDLNLDDINAWLSMAPTNPPKKTSQCGTFQAKSFQQEDAKMHDMSMKSETSEYPSHSGFNDRGDFFDEETLLSDDMAQLDTDSVPPPLLRSNLGVHLSNKEIYEHYNFNHNYNQELPTTKYRKDILRLIKGNSVVIIKGSTGSGKTTQVPQFILDNCAKDGEYCNIVVTQPRKIAAISIANRVSAERNWKVGQLVGYQVGLDKKTTQDTRITYVTTGVLLCQLVKAKHLTNYTHIILDEVHERDQETDFALLVVRKLLCYNSQSVKVILMSATYNTTEFSKYFGVPVEGQLHQAQSIIIEGEQFSSKETFVEHLSSMGQLPILDVNNPDISDEAYDIAARLIDRFDNIEKQDLFKNNGPEFFRGSVLVFLPGLAQIKELAGILEYNKVQKNYQIMPLHSSITMEEQQLVFSKPRQGYRKIVLATNIAESSITVQDIKYVIDFCLTKSLVCDKDTNYQSLRLQWASKASLKQRAGRTGRVSDGHVYRMITSDFYKYNIDEYAVPEMQRCSLENTILKVKMLDLGSPKEILSLAFSPPDVHNIERTILLLKEIGALSTITSHKRFDGDLTFVGTVLASLPLDMRLGKLLMIGFVFGCLNDCLIIAAALSKPCFLACPYNKSLEAFKMRFTWSKGSFSDCIAMLNAYTQWKTLKTSHFFRRARDEIDWGKENFLQIKRVHEVDCLVEELKERLSHFNIKSQDSWYWQDEVDEQQNLLILKIVMAGSFYPNYFVECDVDESARVKEMSTLNPKTTVMFTGLPAGKGFLYKDSIIQQTKNCGIQKAVYYEGSKAFIEFERSKEIPESAVLPAVFNACRLRNTNRKLSIYQCYKEVDNKLAKYPTNFLFDTLDKKHFKYETPTPGDPIWNHIRVTYVGAKLSIWGYKMLPRNLEFMHQIQTEIAKAISEKQQSLKNVHVGMLVLAPSKDKCGDSQYYRALIINIFPLKIWFVDYGNSLSCSSLNLLKTIPDSIMGIPFQVIEFRPRGIEVAKNILDKECLNFISKIIQKSNFVLKLKIYSVVGNVVNADIFTSSDEFLNVLLVEKQLFVKRQEGKLSTNNHKNWELAEEKKIKSGKEYSDKYREDWTEVNDVIRGRKIPISDLKKIDVFGPRTSFETSFSSIINIGGRRRVNIDRSGINNVTIKSEPNNTNSVLMVAAEVGINQTGSTMLARNTTLLPNIQGLQSLLCLLFSPVIELRTNSTETRYTGAICGLGSMLTRCGWCSLFSDHDIEVQFDVDIGPKDLIEVNGIRMMINIAVGGTDEIARWNQKTIRNVQSKIRAKLLNILRKTRNSIEPEPPRISFRWNLIDNDRVASHAVDDLRANRKDFYRLHNAVTLNTNLNDS